MMTWKIRIGVFLVLFFGLVAIINLIRKRRLELKYALTWLLLGAGLLAIVIVPGIIDMLAAVMGIYNSMNMVFFLGFLFSIVVMFVLTMSLSNNADRVRKMAQKMALDEYKLNHKEK